MSIVSKYSLDAKYLVEIHEKLRSIIKDENILYQMQDIIHTYKIHKGQYIFSKSNTITREIRKFNFYSSFSFSKRYRDKLKNKLSISIWLTYKAILQEDPSTHPLNTTSFNKFPIKSILVSKTDNIKTYKIDFLYQQKGNIKPKQETLFLSVLNHNFENDYILGRLCKSKHSAERSLGRVIKKRLINEILY